VSHSLAFVSQEAAFFLSVNWGFNRKVNPHPALITFIFILAVFVICDIMAVFVICDRSSASHKFGYESRPAVSFEDMRVESAHEINC